MNAFLLVLFAQVATQEFELVAAPSRIEAVFERVGDYATAPDGFRKPIAWIRKHGWQPTAGGAATFRDGRAVPPNLDKRRRGTFAVPLNVYGVVLPEPDPGPDAIRLVRSRPLLVLAIDHLGPISAIGTTYERLFAEAKTRGLRYEGSSRETYLVREGDGRQARTRVELVVAQKGVADIGLYAGVGANADGVIAASLGFLDAGLTVRVLDTDALNSGAFARSVRALCMPGGWAQQYEQAVHEMGARKIQKFVEAGGGYLGICAGAYYAAKEIAWGGERHAYDLDLFPGVPAEPTISLPTWPGYALAQVSLDSNHPLTRRLPAKRSALYYGGPFLRPDADARVAVLARFSTTREAAIVALDRKKGRVFLSSVHLEYDLTSERDGTRWPEEELAATSPPSDWSLLQAAARWVAGANGAPSD